MAPKKDNQDKQEEEEKQPEPVDDEDVEKVAKETEEDSAETAKEDEDDENAVKKTNKLRMKVAADAPWKDRMWEVFTTFWPLGLIAFGGPQAHIAILRDHLVDQRDWLDEEQFTELFAIGQGLPGPTSTQLVISTALSRAGPLGGLMAFFLWNLPGLVVLTISGILIEEFVPDEPPFYLAGLPPAAISLVFKAFYGFASKLDDLGICLSLGSCLVAILINNDENIDPRSSQWVFPTVLAIGGLITLFDSKREKPWSTYKAPSKGWEKESDETMKRT
eukprot:scaffold2028_cov191-Amphora_coffeaeformis.AAC.8